MRRVLMLAVGTRGDVQPFVALGLALKRDGFQVRICAPARFRGFVQHHGLEYALMDDGPLALTPALEECVSSTNGCNARDQEFTLTQSLRDAERAAEGCDVIVYHPRALAGPSLAEAHGVPGVMSLPTPGLTPTRAFALPLVTARNLGAVLNRYSYLLLRRANLTGYEEFRRWRSSLGLPDPTRFKPPYRDESGYPVPILYPVSPSVVPRPVDWPASAHLTGYWFAEEEAPSRELEAFVAAGEPPVVVSFGAMTGQRSSPRMLAVINAVERLKRRTVLVSGWDEVEGSGLLEAAAGEIFVTSRAPFGWLFGRSAAVVHHGGAGTTAEALRAGVPSLVCPFFGDQYFWGARVQSLGVGPRPIPRTFLSAKRLTTALKEVLTNQDMCQRAKEIGEHLREEEGVRVACQQLRNIVAAARG